MDPASPPSSSNGHTHDPGQRHVMIGQSPQMIRLFQRAEQLGAKDCPVLLLGETGTGKEVLARAIYRAHAAGPFVPIDCSAMVSSLMESELFGHVKGAFTGAERNKQGLVELADGGTAFFDEIGEMPLEMQSKLLRVLQEKEFRPVGSSQQKRSDFRVIAATNRDLSKEVERGRFRQDLLFRLKVVTLRIPPLRERRQDILPLLEHFLRRHGAQGRLADETREALLAYDWPGNVRELENCVEHMIAISGESLLRLDDLPSSVLNHAAERRSGQQAFAVAVSNQPGVAAGSMTRETHIAGGPADAGEIVPLAEVERRAILRALDVTQGDRTLAAHLLGIGRTTLYRKLREYGDDGQPAESIV